MLPATVVWCLIYIIAHGTDGSMAASRSDGTVFPQMATDSQPIWYRPCIPKDTTSSGGLCSNLHASPARDRNRGDDA